MATFSIVENLDVLKQISAGLFPGFVPHTVHTFAFEHAEEAFDDGVVIAVRSRAQFAPNCTALQL